MKHLEGYLKAFHLITWLFIVSWVVTLIAEGSEWYDTTALIMSIILRLVYIVLFLIGINLVESIINREKQYYYLVQYKYKPSTPLEEGFNILLSIRTTKPIYSLDKFIRNNDISEYIYAKKDKHTLDNGTISITDITLTGTDYKY